MHHRVRSEVAAELFETNDAQALTDAPCDRDATAVLHDALVTLRLTASIRSRPRTGHRQQRAAIEDGDGDLDLPRKSRATSLVISLETLRETEWTRTGAQLWRAALLLADWVLASTSTPGSIRWRHFDWRSRFLDLSAPEYPTTDQDFRWQEQDVSMLESTDVILASDVFYDDELTRLFLDTLYGLMRRYPTAHVFVSAERRIVFSAVTMTEISLGVDTLVTRLCRHDPSTHHRRITRNAVSCSACRGVETARFVATPIATHTIPKAFRDYKREESLQLWALQAVVL
ncbi:hypothetical protein P43SY_001229 [Pythium insidiosum]|uniref:Methyltransferase-like protein 22 n=1 Tax=Pythium insidiosum TaxID=114742 RepID=A0AAD5Q6P9_PYTIN|nr:hypothetical protein P43SY_001229 [Pythium insidiosum]